MLVNENTQIYGNTSDSSGGGVYNTGKFTMQGGSIASNDAGNGFYGGGLYNYVGSVTLNSGVVVQKNNAKEGAGMYLAVTSTTTLNTVTIQNNVLQANGAGTGIYQEIDQKNPANNAVVNETSVTDSDDPGGKPFQGP